MGEIKEIKHNRIVSKVHSYLSSLSITTVDCNLFLLYDSIGNTIIELKYSITTPIIHTETIPKDISIYEDIIFSWVEFNRKRLILEYMKTIW